MGSPFDPDRRLPYPLVGAPLAEGAPGGFGRRPGGLQTQPALLAFALEKTGNDQPNLGYATVYPVAMLLKIILVRILL
jgi:hypothetical protein